MVQYRRNRVPGGTYFFTVTLQDRGSRVLVEHIDALRTVFRETVKERPCKIVAMVVLPEHLHVVWTLPPNDDDYAARWRLIKSRFTRWLVKGGQGFSKSRKGEYNLWQRRYWEHTITDNEDLIRHVDYIHFNPVKHGWVNRAREWPYSTFHKHVKLGWYSPDWAIEEDSNDGIYGE